MNRDAKQFGMSGESLKVCSLSTESLKKQQKNNNNFIQSLDFTPPPQKKKMSDFHVLNVKALSYNVFGFLCSTVA